eukprot:1143607-Pelagomonas_calceolata.AAC.4
MHPNCTKKPQNWRYNIGIHNRKHAPSIAVRSLRTGGTTLASTIANMHPNRSEKPQNCLAVQHWHSAIANMHPNCSEKPQNCLAVQHWHSAIGHSLAFHVGHLAFAVCTVGTGGTITGIGEYLKMQNPDIKVSWVVKAAGTTKDFSEGNVLFVGVPLCGFPFKIGVFTEESRKDTGMIQSCSTSATPALVLPSTTEESKTWRC